jgi:hypothetical protein
VAALRGEGKRLMDKWLVDTDRDVRWIMKENLKKNRLARVDAGCDNVAVTSRLRQPLMGEAHISGS